MCVVPLVPAVGRISGAGGAVFSRVVFGLDIERPGLKFQAAAAIFRPEFGRLGLRSSYCSRGAFEKDAFRAAESASGDTDDGLPAGCGQNLRG